MPTDLRVRFLIFFLASFGALLALGMADPDGLDAPVRTLVALGFGFFCALFWRQISRAWDVWEFFR